MVEKVEILKVEPFGGGQLAVIFCILGFDPAEGSHQTLLMPPYSEAGRHGDQPCLTHVLTFPRQRNIVARTGFLRQVCSVP